MEKAGVDVKIVDCVKERKTVNEIIDFIDVASVDYIGINIFTQNYEIVKYIIENITSSCTCFIGGQAVKSLYKEILDWNVNIKTNIIIGEGEFIIPALVNDKCIQKPEEVNGTKYVYRVNASSEYFPKDISNIYLNRKILGNEILVNHYGQNEIAIITSRGCAFDCAFCGGAKKLNKDIPIRIRSEESVIKEISESLEVYPSVQSVRILDDLFLRNSKSIDLANSIFSKFPQLTWRGMVHVVPLANALDKVIDLKQSKCKELFIGIESGSERIRKRINKLGNVEEIINVSKKVLQNGIDLKGYFILGFSDETLEDFQQTYELAMKLKEISSNTPGNFRTSVFQFRPYHGTQLYKEIVNGKGILHGCEFNEKISKFKGRSQFNFDFGNYSKEPDEILDEYIIKMQRIGEE